MSPKPGILKTLGTYAASILPGRSQVNPAQIQVLSEIVGRAMLAQQLGLQYGGDRDIYQALGYKDPLVYADFYAFYSRFDIARAIIARPVDATWRGGFDLLESDDDKETPLEKAFSDLYDKLALHPKFARLDRLTGIGKYGLLLLGLSDVRNTEGFAQPVQSSSSLKLLWVKPFSEGSAPVEVIEYEINPANERYGQPLFYTITVTDLSTGQSQTIRVHYSRVIHVADGLLESEIEGESRLQVVYNRLQDLEKIVGGSAEMFWRGARPGYQGKVDKEFTLTQATKDALQAQINEYEHNLRRMLLNEGITWDQLASQVADPEKHVLVQLQMISAVTGIPLRILLGSEVGELASTQDRDNWLSLIIGRRTEFAEPFIVRPFVDRCIKYGVLPAPTDEYSVKWQDLWSQSDKEKADIGNVLATAIKSYASTPGAENVVPPASFRTKILGFTDEENDLIEQELDAAMQDEQAQIEAEAKAAAEAAAALPPEALVPPGPNPPNQPANQNPPGGQNGPTR